MLSKWNTTNTFQQNETVLENEKYEFWICHSEVTQRNRDFTKLYIKFRRAWGEFNSHLHTMNCVRLRSEGKGVKTSGRGDGVRGGGGSPILLASSRLAHRLSNMYTGCSSIGFINRPNTFSGEEAKTVELIQYLIPPHLSSIVFEEGPIDAPLLCFGPDFDCSIFHYHLTTKVMLHGTRDYL